MLSLATKIGNKLADDVIEGLYGLLSKRYLITNDEQVRLLEPAMMEQISAQRIADLLKARSGSLISEPAVESVFGEVATLGGRCADRVFEIDERVVDEGGDPRNVVEENG